MPLGGFVAQAARTPTIKQISHKRIRDKGKIAMLLLLIEALGALLILVFIVWWTMFSGRPNGEVSQPDDEKEDSKQ